MVGRRRVKETTASSPLEGYAELTEIGGGAFATVYRAVETETGRPVALKILKVDTIHAHLIETFQREIQALAQVSNHPNIVTLYRPATTDDGRPVLVLELCRESLAQRLRSGGPLDPSYVVHVGIKIAGALESAHRNGFLHRDMKPQNLLVTQYGEAALGDFGVAALQASAQLTAGVFGFTTLHAAPEMLEGHHLSPATDIYGLASTMYQLLAGRAPFAAFDNEAPASVILRIIRDPVRPLRDEKIPLSLADLLDTALRKQPEGRPHSAVDFARALQRIEQEQGWARTAYVAWGEDGRPSPIEGTVSNPRPETRLPEPVEDGPDDHGPAPVPASPGLVAPAVERGRTTETAGSSVSPRPTLPPLLPAAEPERQAIPARRRPSLNRPDWAARNVVSPPGGRRGPPPRPLEPPSEPLAPMSGITVRDFLAAAGRPVYIDPSPDTTAKASRPVNEPTAEPLPAGGRWRLSRAARAALREPRRWMLAGIPGPALAGIAIAMIVLVAAVLLAAGTF